MTRAHVNQNKKNGDTIVKEGKKEKVRRRRQSEEAEWEASC